MMNMEQSVEWGLAGENEVLGENLPSATLSTTNPTWPDLGSNPGRCGGKSANNRINCGMALTLPYYTILSILIFIEDITGANFETCHNLVTIMCKLLQTQKVCNSLTWLWWRVVLAAELLRSMWQVWNVAPVLDLGAHGSCNAGTCNKDIKHHSYITEHLKIIKLLWLVKDELERIWKWLWPNMRYYPGLEEME
jgi:hypothetical protein